MLFFFIRLSKSLSGTTKIPRLAWDGKQLYKKPPWLKLVSRSTRHFTFAMQDADLLVIFDPGDRATVKPHGRIFVIERHYEGSFWSTHAVLPMYRRQGWPSSLSCEWLIEWRGDISYIHVFHPSMKVNRRPLKSSVHSICVCAKSLSVSLSILHFSDILPYLFRPIPRPVEFIYLICWLLTSSSSISYRPIRADKYSHQEGRQNKTRSYAVHPQAEKMLEQIKSGSHLTLHCLVKRITFLGWYWSVTSSLCHLVLTPLGCCLVAHPLTTTFDDAGESELMLAIPLTM